MAKKLTGEYFKKELAEVTPDAVAISVPLHVVIGEAVDVASFFSEHWKTITDGDVVVRPGLDRAGKKIRSNTGQEILALVELVQSAQTQLLLSTAARASVDDVDRARFLVSELDACLAWLFDDGVEDDKDAQLEAVRGAHADTPDSIDALAAELSDYAGLAAKYRAELEGVPEFESGWTGEARSLATSLRERPAGGAKPTKEQAEAMANRNRLLALLLQRVNLVRSATRFIYRNDPATARKVASAYERRRRSSAKKRTPEPAPDPTPV
ncbi:MAG: hypothetical protein HOW73_27685 [Polyangiaceae bacterium]|nr:hypothetical protein [Polyangiaceae bacterium]